MYKFGKEEMNTIINELAEVPAKYSMRLINFLTTKMQDQDLKRGKEIEEAKKRAELDAIPKKKVEKLIPEIVD